MRGPPGAGGSAGRASLRARRLGAGGEPGRVSPILGLTTVAATTGTAASDLHRSGRHLAIGVLVPAPGRSSRAVDQRDGPRRDALARRANPGGGAWATFLHLWARLRPVLRLVTGRRPGAGRPGDVLSAVAVGKRRLGPNGACFAKQWFRHRDLPFQGGTLRSVPCARRDQGPDVVPRLSRVGRSHAPSRSITR